MCVCVCVCVCVTFHTGSAAVFFRGGALKFSIRFRATEGTDRQVSDRCQTGVRQVSDR